MEVTKDDVLRKINYLKDTKSKLADSIKAGGGKLSDPNNFSTYDEVIRTLKKKDGNLTLKLPGWITDGTYCRAIFDIDMSSWPNKNLTNCRSMFKELSSISKLDLSAFNVENVTSFAEMFYDCKSLLSLNTTGWHNNKANTFNNMFTSCSSLTNLDLRWLEVGRGAMNVNINSIFSSCRRLENLDISSWNMSAVYYDSYIFYGCSSLRKVIWPNNFIIRSTRLDLSYCPLYKDNVLDLFKKLKSTTGKEIRLKTSVYNSLKPEDFAIATNKGWSVIK